MSNKKDKKTLNDMIEELYVMHPKISYIDGYTNMNRTCTFYCSVCDRYFKRTFNTILNKDREPCPICRSIEVTIFSRMSKETIYKYRKTNEKAFNEYIYKYKLDANLKYKMKYKDTPTYMDYDKRGRLKDKPENYRKSWTDEDYSKLKQYMDEGMPIYKISQLMKRTVEAIRTQQYYLKFLDNK
jgi:hypothetical protein